MKKYRLALVLLVSLVFAVSACKGKGPQIKLAKDAFTPGETITVVYTALPEYDSSAWIGIIPSGIAHGSEAENDRHDITYQYLRKSTSGEFKFKAPSNAGSYDMRMHDTDNNGREVASATFAVFEPKAAEKKPIEGLSFKKGDAVMVEWKGSWWPAKIIAVQQGNKPYKIHYDGYSNSWNEWVGNNRIKKK
jgi:hypothetical protein